VTWLPIIDAAAHPGFVTGDEIRAYMPKAWRERSFPGAERYQYASPHGEYRPDLQTAEETPGSDPEQFEHELVREHGIERVVLLPLTRGLLANVDLASVICTATNQWLADTWLNSERFRGSIRINPADPDAAISEIERWSGDARFVQVAVPLQSHNPYGQRMFLRIWQAAAEAGLPVAIHADGGASIDFNPTPAGPIRYALEYNVLVPLNVSYHLTSFVAEGVFERLPDLRIVCADGGLSAMTPLAWRLDKDWRSTRNEIPWTKRFPSDYLLEHVRFCLHEADLPRDSAQLDAWWNISGAATHLLYTSNYPHRDFLSPEQASSCFNTSDRESVLFKNATDLYKLGARAQIGEHA
jgi:predicted TIM-barrel fold metal-dependent hydrolase